MMQTILGIDVRPGEIRLAQISRRLRKTTVTGLARVAIDPAAEPAAVAAATRALVDSSALDGEIRVLGIPAAQGMLRRFTFPFTSMQKIRQVLPFELESDLPLPIADLQYDIIRTEIDDQKQQHVLAAAVPAVNLAPLLAALQEVGLDPDMLTFTACGLSAAVAAAEGQLPQALVVVDVGRHGSEVVFLVDGKPRAMRSMRLGLDTLGGEQAGNEAVHTFCSEIMRTVLSAQEGDDSRTPELVILTGEGAGADWLCQTMAACLDVQVAPLARAATLSGAEQLDIMELTACAPAVGLALEAVKPAGFNFRSGRFASSRLEIDWKKHATYLGVAAGIVFLCWLLSAGTDIWLKRQELAAADQEIAAIFHRIVPDVKGTFKLTQYSSIIKARINEIEQSLNLGEGQAGSSIIELLRQVSTALPPGVNMTISLVSVDGKDVQISATADEFKTVEEIKNLLQKGEGFQEVTIRGAKADVSGKGVQFQLSLVRKGVEEATQ